MTPMTNMVKVRRYFYGLTIETNKFAFEVKVTLGLKSTIPEGVVRWVVGSDGIQLILRPIQPDWSWGWG